MDKGSSGDAESPPASSGGASNNSEAATASPCEIGIPLCHFAPSLWSHPCPAFDWSVPHCSHHPAHQPGFSKGFPTFEGLDDSREGLAGPCVTLCSESSPSRVSCLKQPSLAWGRQQRLNRSGFLPEGEHNLCFVHPECQGSPGRQGMQSLHVTSNPS